MTTDPSTGHSLTHEDLMRAAGIEKMARAMCGEMGLDPDAVHKDTSLIWEYFVPSATAALAAWEAHLETTKAPAT